MNKELLLVDDQITTLILATSKYLEMVGQNLLGYPDEKPTPEELLEISKSIELIAHLREMSFDTRKEGKVIKITSEEKDILI